MTTTLRGRWLKAATSCSSSASIAPACRGRRHYRAAAESDSQFQQSAIGLAPFPLPRSSLTSFFWPFFETSAGTVATLPAAALQVHALPLLDRLLVAARPGRGGKLRDAAAPRDLVGGLATADCSLRDELEHDPVGARRALAPLDGQSVSETERRVLAALLRLYGGPDSYYLNFYGPAGSIDTIPFHELLQDGPGAGTRSLRQGRLRR